MSKGYQRLRRERGLIKENGRYYSDFVCDGKRCFRAWGESFIDAQEAHRNYRRFVERQKHGIKNNAVSLQQLYEYWVEYLSISVRPSTLETYKHKMDNVLNIMGKGLLVSAVKQEHVAAYVRARRSDSAADQTIVHEIKALRSMLNWAMNDYIESNPIAKCRIIEKPVEREKAIPTDDEIQKLLDHTHHNKKCPYTDMWLTLASTGLRKDELIHLRWCDIDFKNKCGGVVARTDWRPKTRNAERTFYLSDRLLAALLLRRQYAKAHKTYSEDGCVFPHARNNMLRAFKYCVVATEIRTPKQLKQTSGEAAFTIHGLRRYFATMLASSPQVSIKAASQLLGHASITTTLNVYAKISRHDLETTADAVSQHLSRKAQ